MMPGMANLFDSREQYVGRSTVFTNHVGPWIGILSFTLEFLLIVSAAAVAGAAYHIAVYNDVGQAEFYLLAGLVVGVFFVSLRHYDRRYEIETIVSESDRNWALFIAWNISFVCLLVVGFLTKATDTQSRGAILGFYALGPCALVGARFLISSLVKRGYRQGWFAAKRVFLCGTRQRIDEFRTRYKPAGYGLTIVGEWHLPDEFETAGEKLPVGAHGHLVRAITFARTLDIDDVFLVVPWSSRSLVECCTNSFLSIPASIHLTPEEHFDHFADMQISRIGPARGLKLARAPLSGAEILAKRVMDICLASVGLVLISPFLLLVALAIRLESEGPVIFRQRRNGFNEKEFRIFKFRTMTTMDDGDTIRQATNGDTRITRVGAVLRRWNIDELPQLINVIKGEMSLVGPRPHAVAHNKDFARQIESYARRHNVKPGITGWAQVNGHRGETDTPGKIQARLDHDLYYIENWSVGLDIYILFLTVFSRRARQNAV